jgi:hypothetical protein
MSYKVKQLGNKYICVGPGNKRLPETFRSRRLAMNHLMSLGAAKGDLGRTNDPELTKDTPVYTRVDPVLVVDEVSGISEDSLSLTNSTVSSVTTQQKLLEAVGIMPKLSPPSPKNRYKKKKK